MPGFFHRITEANKLTLNKPVDSDVVYYSELNEWFTQNAFRSFSIKYVADKCIYYKTGNKEHVVKNGNILIACRQPDVKAYFDSKETVKSICIDICPESVAEAFTIFTDKRLELDNYLAGYFRYPEFLETVQPARSVLFHNKIESLLSMIHNSGTDETLHKEWFLDLLETVIYHEYGNYLALNNLNYARRETRKELLTRLLIAKQYMDEEFLDITNIKDVASTCNLSEFHFFRSFRQAFNITPYNYLLKKRLDYASKLLLADVLSVTQIAFQCNFGDIHSFSKTFAKKFGVSPTQFRLRKSN